MRFIILFLISILSYALNLPKEFSADFTQTITSHKKNLVYKGKVFYNQGDIVWKYTYPYKKTIWVKDKIYIYEPDIMQVTIAKRKNNTLSDILKRSKKVKDHLYKATIENKTVYFIYDKMLKKIFYTDEVGNKVNIVFYNQKKHAPKNIFKLTYPQNVDVIYQN